MLSKVFSGATIGLEAKIIEVEVNTSYGLRHFEIVGLPDKAIQESKERVGAAIESTGFKSPHSQPVRVLVSLAPADLKKEGSIYDLPIALAFLLSAEKIHFNPKGKIFLGELSLSGKLRKVKGVLAIALLAKRKGFQEIILPKENAQEAAFVRGLKVVGLENLKEAIDYLEGRLAIKPSKRAKISKEPQYEIDLAFIKGQESSKRALEIVAAGGHNLLMVGPPGTGKTLLAKAIPSILPPLSFQESLEVTKIYSIAGLLSSKRSIIVERPFRSPHHIASRVALVGGGNPPRPGEITLAHRGVLFLDEFPEFHRDVLESLRQPMEDGKITIVRAGHSVTFPARFILVAASNPTPSGYYTSYEISSAQAAMYRRKLSGPIIDRIDIFINVPPVKYGKLTSQRKELLSPKIRERVIKARAREKERFGKEKTNAEMTIPEIEKYCSVDLKSKDFLRDYVNSGKLSARGYHRVLKVARTIADLEGKEEISFEHISEAVMYRVRKS